MGHEAEGYEKKFLTRFLMVVAILVVYVTLVSFLFSFSFNLFSGPYCDCSVSLTWILTLLSATGIMVGMLIYYFLIGSFKREKRDIEENVNATLNLLPSSERKIVEILIEKGGKEHQNNIVEETGFNKAKVSRRISGLVDKGIVEKKKVGMSNLIVLKEPFSDLYLDQKD